MMKNSSTLATIEGSGVFREAAANAVTVPCGLARFPAWLDRTHGWSPVVFFPPYVFNTCGDEFVNQPAAPRALKSGKRLADSLQKGKDNVVHWN